MNSDTVLSSMDLIDNHHFMQYFNNDQSHYMSTNNNEHMPQLDDTTSQPSMHYIHNKTPINKSHTTRANMNSMNQPYAHNINAMATMNTQLLTNSHMVPHVDQNSSDNQIRYCKVSATSMSNHFETPPMQPTYQANHIQNHHSPSHNRTDMNHFNDSVNISNTLTHISETDNSNVHNNYAPTPPLSQPLANHSPNNMISTPQTYSNLPCHSSNNWSTIPSNIPNMSNINNMKNSNQATFGSRREESQFSYLDQPNADYLSITSTPMNSQSINDIYMMRPSKPVINKNSLSKNLSILPPKDIHKKPKNSINPNSGVFSNSIKKDCISAEKRNVIIFKVLEQFIDPTTKNILKETVTKNEEIVISLGQVSYDSLNNSSTSSMMTRSPVGSSGVLGDISTLSNTKSIENTSSSNSIGFQNPIKIDSSFEPQSDKIETKLKLNQSLPETNKIQLKESHVSTPPNSSIDENDEEARRQTATALLSLQSVSNNSTPVKPVEEDAYQITTEISTVLSNASKISSALADEEKNSASENESDFSTCQKLKTGAKVLAKWKDKNFYPAEILSQLETYKWSVRFDDLATRNLFETEIIRVEHLFPKQEVMLTLSGDLCIRASIKKNYNNKNFELDLEYTNNDKLIIKKYKLKDIFLNSEQSSLILNKVSKPNNSCAVFADVDLDNIVTGKRARSNKVSAKLKKKSTQESSSSDSDVPNKKKRKTVDETVSNQKSSTDLTKIDFHLIGHYHESSLSVSPRSTKNSVSMPANELEKILGPVPKLGSKIFNKINFILTSGDRNKKLNEQESNPEHSTPFDKVYLTRQIQAGEGSVYDSFEEMKSSGENLECVLIADTYHRSIKYIQCLAAGIPIASHLWVIDCCRKNTLLDRDSYILPAGYSVITHSLSSDKNTLKKSSVLFKGMKFYFGSKSAEKLEKLWKPVLFAAQAIIVKQDPNMHNVLIRKLVDIIIADASCSSELVKRAKQVKIPIISSEYIVQCLINGRKLSYDACPSFAYSHK